MNTLARRLVPVALDSPPGAVYSRHGRPPPESAAEKARLPHCRLATAELPIDARRSERQSRPQKTFTESMSGGANANFGA